MAFQTVSDHRRPFAKSQPRVQSAACPSEPSEVRKIINKKNSGHFAKFSPVNSFRISKTTPRRSSKYVELSRIRGKQLLWNQHSRCSFAPCALSPLNCLIFLSLFRFLVLDPRSTVQGPRLTIHWWRVRDLGWLARSDIFGTQRFCARSQSESGNARNLRSAHRTWALRRNSKQRGTL